MIEELKSVKGQPRRYNPIPTPAWHVYHRPIDNTLNKKERRNAI